jgi:hypothetical protein
MKIQSDKVEAKRLSLTAQYHGFDDDDYIISTDVMRLQQVLLNY